MGVRIDNVGLIGGRGVEPDIYPAGGTYFFLRAFSTWYTFDTALQNLAMVRQQSTGDRTGDDSLRLKTVDGNDVSVNVTVSWRIEPAKAPYLAQHVGQSHVQVAGRGQRRPRVLLRGGEGLLVESACGVRAASREPHVGQHHRRSQRVQGRSRTMPW